MSGFLGKFKEFVGLPSTDDYDDYDDLADIQEESYADTYDVRSESIVGEVGDQFSAPMEPEYRQKSEAGVSKVVGMPGSSRFWGSAAEVLVIEPRAFEEMPNIIQALRERKSVVLNLSLMDAAQAQRAVDFVAGATFTIDGHQERVGENIFLFTPSCVQVRTKAGVIHEAPQPQEAAGSNVAMTSWQTDPLLGQIAQ